MPGNLLGKRSALRLAVAGRKAVRESHPRVTLCDKRVHLRLPIARQGKRRASSKRSGQLIQDRYPSVLADARDLAFIEMIGLGFLALREPVAQPIMDRRDIVARAHINPV